MSRVITELHPKLQVLAAELVDKCAKTGLKVKITDCVRSASEQADCIKRGTSSVKYPYSHHNWGTAFDFCRDDGKGFYNNEGNFFQNVGAIGQGLGLEWGGAWTTPVDMPHFQLPDWGTGTGKLIELYGNPDVFRKTWTAIPNPQPKGDFANMTNAEKQKYVAGLYPIYTGRVGDRDGINYWAAEIKDTTSLMEFERRFSQLEECRKYAVKCAYRNVLGREADTSGLTFWAEWLKNKTVLELYAALAAAKKTGAK